MSDASHAHPRRRTALTIAAVAALALGGGLAVAGTSAAATTLGASAAASGRVFGAAVANGHLSETDYATTLDTEFNGLTPENEMKWDTTEASRGSFNYTAADNLVSHAQSHGMKVRGHTLVWHSQLPSWVSSITTGTELLSVMRNHIANVAGHFAGKIQYWDVVNEAFDGSARRQSVFQTLIGDSYIEEAFIAARAADPAAKLCYNDYSTDGVNAKSTAILAMVQDFKSRGVPIDCVGFQAHLILGQVPSDFQANLQRFVDAGVDVNITELDIRMATPATTANLTAQASDYQKVIAGCMAITRCTSMTTWGVTDKYSWIPSVFAGQGAALLFDESYAKKPAYNSVLTALGGTVPTTSATPTATATATPTGTSACRVTYTMSTWNTGFTASVAVANTGTSAVNGWALVFTLPSGQVVTNAWNTTISPTSGQVTASNVSYNAAIPVNGSTTFGFQATHTGNTAEPSAFSLNGAACAVA